MFWLRRKYVGLDRRALVGFAGVGLLLAYPLILRTLSGEIQGRYKSLSVFNPEYLRHVGASSPLSIAGIFLDNILVHLSPRYLLVSGDANLRHSSQFSGQLGWLDSLALAIGVLLLMLDWLHSRVGPETSSRIPLKWMLLLSTWGFLTGTIPAALTWEGIPHALRSIGAWPFVSSVTGLILWRAASRWRAILPLALATSLAFGVSYSLDYFGRYRSVAARWFDAGVVERAREARRTGNWEEFDRLTTSYPAMAVRYHRIAFRGESCTSSH